MRASPAAATLGCLSICNETSLPAQNGVRLRGRHAATRRHALAVRSARRTG